MARYLEARRGPIRKSSLQNERKLNQQYRKKDHADRLRISREIKPNVSSEPVGEFIVGQNGALVFKQQ